MKLTSWNLSVSGAAITGFAPADSPGFRVVNLFRGTYPGIWDNFTASCQFTLAIYREHDSAADALRFAATHRQDVGHVVRMEISGNGVTLAIPRAGITPKCQRRLGAATWFHYEITAQTINVGAKTISRL